MCFLFVYKPYNSYWYNYTVMEADNCLSERFCRMFRRISLVNPKLWHCKFFIYTDILLENNAIIKTLKYNTVPYSVDSHFRTVLLLRIFLSQKIKKLDKNTHFSCAHKDRNHHVHDYKMTYFPCTVQELLFSSALVIIEFLNKSDKYFLKQRENIKQKKEKIPKAKRK